MDPPPPPPSPPLAAPPDQPRPELQLPTNVTFVHSGTTPSPSVPMDETSESQEAGIPLSEEASADIDVALGTAVEDALAEDSEGGEVPGKLSRPRGAAAEASPEPPPKRGRPPKAEGTETRKRGRSSKVTPTKTPAKRRKEKEDEYVCFICFDGGELVLCDRRDCPKVYHPSCVNRDEAYFRAKGIWNCGWHICSICTKSSHYMCYTCTFSLCKSCIAKAGFVRVRGNKGFCDACMGIVLSIESRDDGNNKTEELDFDNENSWMYFFKDYWLDLKQKLSLTLDELIRAKEPAKDLNVSSGDLGTAKDVERGSSDSFAGRSKVSISSNKKTKRRARKIIDEESSVQEAESEGASMSRNAVWASKELLEFVTHVKDGDRSALSQLDVEALLLEYIKLKNLQNPGVKSEIICDARLRKLFGKTRVGHFEMLKLLESHFLSKTASPVDTDDNQGGVLDPDPSQMDTEGNYTSTKMSLDRRRRPQNRLEEKESQTNRHDYAAIDIHNVNLIYLRRNLMEDLVDDIEAFSDKVVGTFVRIRISTAGQGQDLYRLVQVVGTGKAAKKYRTGKKNTDLMLEILNLNKKELISIDNISNQMFDEEECKRLRQSIKCGLIGRLTVGGIREKARVLQAVRVKDWCENEKLRLGNLRDRASEKGHRKEHRDCVEKLRILSTPKERLRRLNEVPEIHVDPKMNPDYESSEDDEDDKKPDDSDHTREPVFLGSGSHASSSGNGVNSTQNNANTVCELKRNSPTESSTNVVPPTSAGNEPNESSFHQEVHVQQASSLPVFHQEVQVQQTSSLQVLDNPPMLTSGQSSVIANETISTASVMKSMVPSTASLIKSVVPSNTSETEKMWYYKDPSGKVQGPFSLTQLRKWNKNGYFPASLEIWKASEPQENSILLADALIGKFHKDMPGVPTEHNSTASQAATVVNSIDAKEDVSGENDGNIMTDNNQNAVNWKVGQTVSGPSAQTDMWSAQSAAKLEVINPINGRVGVSFGGLQSNENTPLSGQLLGPSGPRHVPPFSGNPQRSSSYNGRGGRGRWNGGQDRQSWNMNMNKTSRMHPSNRGHERYPGNRGYERHLNWSNSQQQSSGRQLNRLPENNTSNQLRHDSFNLPTLQPAQPNVQGPITNFTSTIPAQQMNSGWGTTYMGNEGQNPTMGPYVTAQAINSVGGGSSFSNASHQCPVTPPSVPNTILVTETALPGKISEENDGRNYSQISDEHPKSVSGAQSISGDVQFPCPDKTVNPIGEITCSAELSQLKANDNLISENRAVSVDCGELFPATCTRQSNSKLDTPVSDDHQPLNLPSSKTMAASDVSESVSAQVSAVSVESKQEPDGSNSASVFPAMEHALSSKSEPSVTGTVVPVNLAVLTEVPSKAALQNISTTIVPSVANSSMTGVPVAQVNENAGWGAVTEGNMNVSWEIPAQRNANMSTCWRPSVLANPSANVDWGSPAQGDGNANTGCGAPAQGDINVNSGAPAQGGINVNSGAPAQGGINGAPALVDGNVNTVWGAPAQGGVNANMSWGTPSKGNVNQNPNWGNTASTPSWGVSLQGNSAQGNATVNTGWVAGQENTYTTWNNNSMITLQNWTGGRSDGRFHGRNLGQRGGRPSWNRVQPDGGNGSLQPPMFGESGVCMYHEMGHCRKGAFCHYRHP